MCENSKVGLVLGGSLGKHVRVRIPFIDEADIAEITARVASELQNDSKIALLSSRS